MRCWLSNLIPRRRGHLAAGLAPRLGAAKRVASDAAEWSGVLLVVISAVGCASSNRMNTPVLTIAEGEYGDARTQLYAEMSNDKGDRRYLLDRVRVGVLTLADGYPESARNVLSEAYEVLRTQGVNRDKTVQAVVINEDLKTWKGEPFEQALALAYYSMTMAELGSWDNARAAADNALFYLQDFSGEEDAGASRAIDVEEITRRSLAYERAVARGEDPDAALARTGTADIDRGYVPRPSDFKLGHLLHGIASQQLARGDEADDHFAAAQRFDPALSELTDTLRSNRYNTVLVVSWGVGPRRVAYGPDGALVRYEPTFASDDAALSVTIDGATRRYPVVTDVNRMAASHLWNSLEDVRVFKSTAGDVLVTGGVLAAVIGADHHSDAAVIAGLAAAATGLFLKAGAHADLRFADTFPQRYYVVPLYVTSPEQQIELRIDGASASRLVLTGLAPPEGPEAQLRYVRLVSGTGPGATPPRWATSGEVAVANEHVRQVPGPQVPYVLGGDDAQPPDDRAMRVYDADGTIPGFTAADIREAYRLEVVRLTTRDQFGYADKHVIEGGSSLVAPLPGTAGFARLFGTPPPPYRPQTRQVAEWAADVRGPTLPSPTLPSPTLPSPTPYEPIARDAASMDRR